MKLVNAAKEASELADVQAQLICYGFGMFATFRTSTYVDLLSLFLYSIAEISPPCNIFVVLYYVCNDFML